MRGDAADTGFTRDRECDTQGNENYERLRKLLYDEYPGQFKLTNVLMASIGKQADSQSIRSGSITLTEGSMRDAYRYLDFVSNINRGLNIDGMCLTSKLANAIIFAVQVDGVDSDRLSRAIEKNYRPKTDDGNYMACLEWMSYVYNLGLSRSLPRFYFEKEWEDAWENKKSWYHVKWGHVKNSEHRNGADRLVSQPRLDFDTQE